MTRWLVTGATGLMGSNAALHLAPHHDVVGLARTASNLGPVPVVGVDLGNAGSREGLLERIAPTVVLHAAAMASIEGCARDPTRAHEINVTASADLARQAASSGAAFVYISTDAVFDGTTGSYREADDPFPTSEYGRSKLAGERAVLDANPRALIARVNFYGWSPNGERSLAEFFHSRLSRGEQVAGFRDVIVSTLYIDCLVRSLIDLVGRKVSGIVHVASSEATSKFDFGQRVAATFGFDPNLVIPALSTDHLAVRRGTRLNLDTSFVEELLGRRMTGQQEGLDRLLAAHVAGRPRELTRFMTEKAV